MATPRIWMLGLGVALAASGCASTSTSDGDSAQVLRESNRRIADLEREVQQREARIESLSEQLEETRSLPAVSAAPRGSSSSAYTNISGGELLPPSAQPGECYARVFVPPTYESRSEQVLRREAGSRVETIPAQYETVTEQVLVKEASSRLVTVPATYETVSERVLVQDGREYWTLGKGRKASEADMSLVDEASKLGLDLASASPGSCFEERIIPAKYETRTEQVLVSEASAKVDVVPAKYEMVDERVLVKEASTRIVEVPAVYETVSEKILVKPAHTIWKKGSGPIQRVDDSTGEIMCLVEVPAEYKTVTKRVLKTPATTKTVEVPAEYKTVKVRRMVSAPQERRTDIPAKYSNVTKRDKISDARRLWAPAGSKADGSRTGRQLCKAETAPRYETVSRRVVKTPATTKTVAVPAEYKTVKVTKVKTPASTRTIAIPAEYDTVTKRVQVSDGSIAWKPILCETNATPNLVRNLQRALKTAGHNPGPVDGVLGAQTLDAVKGYQKAKGLPTGGITIATLRSLGVQ